jgi:hypothetical protein
MAAVSVDLTPASAMPCARLVLLGASNLTFAFSRVIAAARGRAGGPLAVLGAVGHGRSYGRWSNVFGRGLPGIVECGLWDALAAGEGQTMALLTDVGNDIGYGESAADVAGWVETCLDRLERVGARVALTLLPAANIARLGPLRFRLTGGLLYPGRPLRRDRVLAEVAELDARLRALATARGCRLVVPRPEWYGADAIHIRRRALEAAWDEQLGACWDGASAGGADAGPRLRGLAPACRTVLGVEVRRPQPCAVLGDGTSVALY